MVLVALKVAWTLRPTVGQWLILLAMLNGRWVQSQPAIPEVTARLWGKMREVIHIIKPMRTFVTFIKM
jgi:hypothetical protein